MESTPYAFTHGLDYASMTGVLTRPNPLCPLRGCTPGPRVPDGPGHSGALMSRPVTGQSVGRAIRPPLR
jgi:hypothetical protein